MGFRENTDNPGQKAQPQMKYKRHAKYYFINKTTKELDHLRVIDIFENGFIYLYKEEYKFCSFKNAEGKLYESDWDVELLSKLGTTRQKCYYGSTHRCKPHIHCPCPKFIHVLDPSAISKIIAEDACANKAPEHEDLELYPFGDR